MLITQEQINSQLETLKDCAAKSVNPCLISQYIAFSDEKVRKVLWEKLKIGYVFRGISCLDRIGIPEYQYVHFSFDCIPDTYCLINPSFVVIVNFVDGQVVSILDPYFGGVDISSSAI